MKSTPIIILLAVLLAACGSDDIVIPSLGSIRGVVKGPVIQSPLANVQISTVPGTSILLTNEHGEYNIPNVAAGDYIIQAEYRDSVMAGHASMPIRVVSGAATTADLILKPGSPSAGVIAGRVTDESGKPVQGANVTIDVPYSETLTSADGSFMFNNAAPGSVTVNVVSGMLCGAAVVNVLVDQIVPVTIAIYAQDPTRGSVTGIVSADQKPVVGAIVSIPSIGLTTSTDANGSYILRNVPAGPYTLFASKDGLRTRRFDISVAAARATPRNVDMSGSLPAFSTDRLELYMAMNGNINDKSPMKRPMKSGGISLKYVADRFDVANEAMEFNGFNYVSTVEGSTMNFKTITIGVWLYIPSAATLNRSVLGKTLHPNGDGYYLMVDNSLYGKMTFVYVVGGTWARNTRFDIGDVPKDKWFWVGFSVDNIGNGWATINGTNIKSTNTNAYDGATTSAQQFQIGNLESTAGLPGFSGKMDHFVLYSRYMTLNELQLIMEEKD